MPSLNVTHRNKEYAIVRIRVTWYTFVYIGVISCNMVHVPAQLLTFSMHH